MQAVEYTHGPDEMGADFVFSRTHQVLGEVEYVGVIAKIGKLVQDYSDVERQIEECFIPRTVGGGKRRVRLDEVWVVVTEHITKNAQEKVQSKYSAAKVHFIDGERLAALIDRFIPDYWTNIDLDVGEYLALLRARNLEADRRSSLIQAGESSFYVEQEVVRVLEDEYKAKGQRRPRPPVPVDLRGEIANNDFVLVEGGMGAGKSKLLRRLVELYTAPETYLETKILPVHTTYKEFADDFKGDLGATVAAATSRVITDLSKTGATPLVLIDGFDEKSMTIDEEVAALGDIARQIKDGVGIKVVLASRPLNVYDRAPAVARGIAHYDIRPLTMKGVIGFLDALCEKLDLHTRIIEDLKKSQLFKELPRSPIAAILLARLLNESSQDIPSNMTELYAKYMELVLGRWDIEKGLQSQKEYEALDTLMADLAVYMIDNDLVAVSATEVQERFADYLKERNLDIDAASLFTRVLDRSGVIASDTGAGTVAFKHRTFAEFLYAKRNVKHGGMKMDRRAFGIYWPHVYFFWFGLVRDAPEELTQLLRLSPVSEGERWGKRVQLANYCLAAYATPYNVVVATFAHAMLDAAAHFQQLVKGEIKSPFTALTRMQVLYLMQFIVRNTFGYEFFADAVDETALQIADAAGTEEEKAYAVFFLSVAAIDAGKTAAFDFLLGEYAGRLPIDIALALSHEGDRMKLKSEVVKKQDRRIRKALKADPALREQLDRLYEVPLLPASDRSGTSH